MKYKINVVKNEGDSKAIHKLGLVSVGMKELNSSKIMAVTGGLGLGSMLVATTMLGLCKISCALLAKDNGCANACEEMYKSMTGGY